jgi:hypothetical protein
MPSTTAIQKKSLIPEIRDVWDGLSAEERLEASEAFLTDAGNHKKIIRPLSRKVNFREVALQRQSLEWKAKKLAAYMLSSELIGHLDDVLKCLHFEKRRDLMIAFLDAAGIPHNNGGIDGEIDQPPDNERLVAGYKAVRLDYPRDVILTYFRTLLALEGDGGTWQALPSLLARIEEETCTEDTPTGRVQQEPEAQGTLPESSEEFTSLDNLLIQTIVHTALQIEGAPSREQLDDLTGELLSLSGTRKRSFFHRGFYDAIFSEDVCAAHEGENVESRLWYVAGAVMGWTRRKKTELVVDFFSKEATLLEEIVADQNSSRIRMLLPVLYPACRDHGLHSTAVGLLQQGLPKLEGRRWFDLCRSVLADSAAFLREGDAASALAYLETLPEPDFSQENISSRFASFGRRLIRKKAQCLQMLGHMEAAEERLKFLSEFGDFEESIEAVTDLGLIVGGFESIYRILPMSDREIYITKVKALERGRNLFENATNRERGPQESRARNARFALGILAAFGKRNEPLEAAKHFTLALTGMLRDEAAYSAGNLLDWTKFLLGLAALETCDESRLAAASAHIRHALKNNAAWPSWLLLRCLDAAALHDDRDLVSEVADTLLKLDDEEAFPKIRTTGALKKIPALLEKYANWILGAKLSVKKREEEWTFLLRLALEAEDLKVAEKALEELEVLAHEWRDFTDRFLLLLADSINYSPTWTPFDADEASIHLLESRGRFEEAAEFLKQRFWEARVERTPKAKAECEAILAALEEMGRPESDLNAMRQNVPELAEAASEAAGSEDLAHGKLRKGAGVSVLFVGGNETQARYDKQIKEEIASFFSGVTVDFEHPGWGSNWAPVCDLIQSRLSSYDAIVLSHLVRTNMGRRIRKMCGEAPPWFACRGKGAESIKRSIVQAAIRACELNTLNPKV